MNDNNLKFFIYVRKSTESEERQVRSIPDQLAELREKIRMDGLAVVDILEESQILKVKGRPVFNEMLSRIEAGEANAIIGVTPTASPATPTTAAGSSISSMRGRFSICDSAPSGLSQPHRASSC